MKVNPVCGVNYGPKQVNQKKQCPCTNEITTENQNVNFHGKGMAVLGAGVAGFVGFLLGGPVGAAIGAAIGGGAGALSDDKGELSDYERYKISHYD